MKAKNLLLLIAIIGLAIGCNQQSGADQTNEDAIITAADTALMQSAQAWFQPLPTIAENPANPLSPGKLHSEKRFITTKGLVKTKTSVVTPAITWKLLVWIMKLPPTAIPAKRAIVIRRQF